MISSYLYPNRPLVLSVQLGLVLRVLLSVHRRPLGILLPGQRALSQVRTPVVAEAECLSDWHLPQRTDRGGRFVEEAGNGMIPLWMYLRRWHLVFQALASA